MTQKKGKCIIYANCQRNFVARTLKASSSFNRHFEIENNVPFNFEAINQKYVIPDETLKNTKLFLYQPIAQEKYEEQSSDYILSRLPSDCVHISFPHLQFNGYHPQYIHNSLNPPTEDYPFGKFPYGDRNVIQMFDAGIPKEEIIKEVSRVNFYSKESLLKVVNSTLDNLAVREADTDIRISNFIRDNYRYQRLFHTVNHPANIIGIIIVSQILAKLNMLTVADQARFFILQQGGKVVGSSQSEAKIVRIFREVFGNYQVPIYPSVIENLGLTFVQKTSRYRLPFANKKITFEEYLEEYFAQYPSESKDSSISQSAA
jgi:hypothetical protein